MPATGTRRERVRALTTAEIRASARSLLVDAGPQALSLRAVAREMGMTAPALYRYVDGLDALVGLVCADILDELTDHLRAARDTGPADDPVGRLLAACRAFRTWSLAHPREFQLTFASEPPHSAEGGRRESEPDPLSFGAVFLEAFVDIWRAAPFTVPDEESLPPALRSQLAHFHETCGGVLPPAVLLAFLAGWVRLYGAVTIEVFGHLGFAFDDPEPMFEAMLADMRRSLAPA